MTRHLHRVEIENWKAARAVQFTVRPGANELVGPNESGKSSSLDAIVGALAGARHIDPQPLTTGADSGKVVLDLGDLIVERTLTERSAPTGGTLKVKVVDKKKFGQRELDALFGDFSFDPLAFSRMRPADQVVALQALAGPDFVDGLATLDQQIEEAKLRRRDAKRDLDRFGAIPVEPEPEVIDASALMAELRTIEEFNNKQEEVERSNISASRAVQSALEKYQLSVDEANKAREALRLAEEHERRAIKEYQDIDEAARALPAALPRRDSAELRARLADAGRSAQAHAQWAANRAKLDELRVATGAVAELEVKVADLERRRVEHAKTLGSRLPIEGIAWTREGVTVGGLPWDQLSSGQRLVLSARVGMSTHPELRLMMIRDGSLLDQEHFATLAALADEEQFDLLIETVGEGHKGDHQVIEIREGRTAGAPESPETPDAVLAAIEADRVIDPWSADE